MTYRSLLPALFTLFCAVFGLENCKDNCDNDVSIDAVQPHSSPAGYEVLLKTSGFSDTLKAKVFFGLVEAVTKPGGQPGEIITTVPHGLLGNIEISVEEEDCIGRSTEFAVTGSLPSNVQPSLVNIVIPVPLSGTPPTGIGNVWVNAASTFNDNGAEQTIFIVEGTAIGDLINFDETQSVETNKSIKSPVSGFANLSTLEVQIVIDRTSNGGIIEHFDGQFIDKPGFLPITANYAILLVSRETGRQLLIYTP